MKSTKKPSKKNASHIENENHPTFASHSVSENQHLIASQGPSETHESLAIQSATLRLMVDQRDTVQRARIKMGNRRLAIANVHEISPDSISIAGVDDAMQRIENGYARAFERNLETMPIYTEFLSKVRGIGPTLAAQIVGYIGDIGKFARISDLWHYSGFHVENGEAVKLKRGVQVSWNPAMKRACFNIGQSFVRGGNYYRALYDETKPKEAQKHRENGCGRGKDCSEKLHVDNRTRRIVIKRFLSNFWEAWRELQGLPAPKPYAQEYLGHKNFVSWKDVIAYETQEPQQR